MAEALNKRLRAAREAAGFDTATDAANALGIPVQTYIGHENNRGFKRDSADRYARKFNVSLEWLQTGKGPKERAARPVGSPAPVPIIGYVSAGQTHFFEAGKLGEIEPPAGASDNTVAVEIRGTSLGEAFDGWIAFYDDVQRPVSPEHHGRLCVVGLLDGRVLIKIVKKARGKNTFHLFSNGSEPPILDVEVEWAARVRNMVPR